MRSNGSARGPDRLELGRREPVIDDPHDAFGFADAGAEATGDVVALEQEDVGAPRHEALRAHVEGVARRAGRVIEAAAMRRIGADGFTAPREGEARIQAALGAMAMQHVRAQRPCDPARRQEGRKIARVRIAAHRKARHPERQMRAERGEQLLGARAARGFVAQDADRVTAFALAAGHVEHVAEEAADRRAEDVQDAQRTRAGRHRRLTRDDGRRSRDGALDVQNQRSLMRIVSPGFIG